MKILIFTLSLLLTTTVYAQTETPAFVPTAEEAAQADVFAEQFAGCSALLIIWAGVKTTTPDDAPPQESERLLMAESGP